ncbi:MAG TPA: hypothetical protein PLA38_01335 [bacterium]|nr:hypothetical protein [bacterium]HQI94759.1 hypothetical protein [bacterium]
MEKTLSPENFRDNLAKTLRSIPDHKTRQQVSETLEDTPSYKEAKERRNYWRDRGNALYKEIMKLQEEGQLELRNPWEPVSDEVLNDPSIIKLEAGGKYDEEKLIIEHRNIKESEHILLPASSAQIAHLFVRDPKKAKQIFENKKVVLGDVDLGGAFSYWLISEIRAGKDIRSYQKLLDFVTQHDIDGRIAIFPYSEPDSSLAEVNWGITLAHDQDKEKRLALFLQTFERIVKEGYDPYGSVPFPNTQTKMIFEKWRDESREAIDQAIREGSFTKDAVILRDFSPLGTTRWDQACVDVHRRFNGEKLAITISRPNDKGEREMQASSFGTYYIAPLGAELSRNGKNAWFGSGYVGLYSSPDYTQDDFIKDVEEYIEKNRESIKNVAEFEVVFDDQQFLESILGEALRGGLVTGFIQSPDYFKATSSYLWDEYGTALAEGKERHTKINTDDIVISRFMVAQRDVSKVFEFLNSKLSTKWDTPLIQITEKGVNKKFKDYLEQNVKNE